MLSTLKNQRGVSAVYLAVILVVLIGFSALAVDLGHRHVIKGELQNAADAGSLAGASALYNEDGTDVEYQDAIQKAVDAAKANLSQKVSVDIYDDNGDLVQESGGTYPYSFSDNKTGDVRIGHWSFSGDCSKPGFSSDVLPPYDPPVLWDVTDEELDCDTNFINAVQVVAHRKATPIKAFFDKIFGNTNYEMSATATAYIGFAGQNFPVDLPIAVCLDKIRYNNGVGEVYSCNIGRMYNTTTETAMWTSLEICKDEGGPSVNTGSVIDDICVADNWFNSPTGNLGTNNGEIQPALEDVVDCWKNRIMDESEPIGDTVPWKVRLPVIYCEEMSNQTCARVFGPVELYILWINEDKKEYPISMDAVRWDSDENGDIDEDDDPVLDPVTNQPQYPSWPDNAKNYNEKLDEFMGGKYADLVNDPYTSLDEGRTDVWVDDILKWTDDTADSYWDIRWDSFSDHFNLKIINPDFDPNSQIDPVSNPYYLPAPFANKTIYFLPSCTAAKVTGNSTNVNSGILARNAVLVK